MADRITVHSEAHYPHGKRRLRGTQRRIYTLTAALCVCIICILMGVLIPVLALKHRDDVQRERSLAHEERVVDYWMNIFRNSIVRTVSTAYCVQGFILGQIQSIPPFNGTIEERTKGQYFSRFEDVVHTVNGTNGDLCVVMSAPGGIYYQSLPTMGVLMTDGFVVEKIPGKPSPMDTVLSGTGTLFGPWRLVDEGCNLIIWAIGIRQPVYGVTSVKDHGIDTFWGFAYVFLSIDSLMMIENLTAYMAEEDVDYLVYTFSESKTIDPIATSMSPNATEAELRDLVQRGVSRSVSPNEVDWLLAVRSRDDRQYITRANIGIIAMSAVMGSFLLFLFVVGFIMYCTRVYDGRPYAPKTAPFAMLTVGPCDSAELWNLASDHMVDVTERLKEMLDRAMATHHAYPITQLRPSAHSYTTRNVVDAVHMAFEVLEELHSHRIDGPLCRLLGEDGRLLVSCAVHWCRDATVTMEPSGESLLYEGPDVVYGGRMWVFARPNSVTLSEAAREKLRGDPQHAVTYLNSVYLRGVKARQNLYVITDTTNKKLCGAAEVAEGRLRRVRDAQEHPVDLDSTSTSGSRSPCNNPLVAKRHDADPMRWGPGEGTATVFCPCRDGTSSSATTTGTNRSAAGIAGGGGADHLPGADGSGRAFPPVSRPAASATTASGGAHGQQQPTSRAHSGGDHHADTLSNTNWSKITRRVTRHIDMPANLACVAVNGSRLPLRCGKDSTGASPTPDDAPHGGATAAETITPGRLGSPTTPLNGTAVPHPEMPATDASQVKGILVPSSLVAADTVETGSLGDTNTTEASLAYALLHPSIATWLDAALRDAFEHHSLTIDVSYDSMRIMVYYFFCSFKLLFRPLAAPERVNIYKRLTTAFGVPQQGILEHLAARCTILYIQQHESKSLLWGHQQLQAKRSQQGLRKPLDEQMEDQNATSTTAVAIPETETGPPLEKVQRLSR